MPAGIYRLEVAVEVVCEPFRGREVAAIDFAAAADAVQGVLRAQYGERAGDGAGTLGAVADLLDLSVLVSALNLTPGALSRQPAPQRSRAALRPRLPRSAARRGFGCSGQPAPGVAPASCRRYGRPSAMTSVSSVFPELALRPPGCRPRVR